MNQPTAPAWLFALLVGSLLLCSQPAQSQPVKGLSKSDLFQEQLEQMPSPAWNDLPDPFLRSAGFVPSETGDEKYKLEAILFDLETPQAVIDGEIVNAGDILRGGRRVAVIGRNYVHLERGNSLLELSLSGPAANKVSMRVDSATEYLRKAASPRKEP